MPENRPLTGLSNTVATEALDKPKTFVDGQPQTPQKDGYQAGGKAAEKDMCVQAWFRAFSNCVTLDMFLPAPMPQLPSTLSE